MTKDHKILGWNYTPDMPTQVSPLFIWPLRPKYEDLDCSAMVWISRKLDPGLCLHDNSA